MKNAKTFASMLVVSGGLAVAVAAPNAAIASCGGYSPPPQSSTSGYGYQNNETPEQREARIAAQKAAREARKAARLAKKEAKEAAAAAAASAKSTAVASN
jgi:pyruvoyl-dependent arginine decarboxylase (PvlArgDC)